MKQRTAMESAPTRVLPPSPLDRKRGRYLPTRVAIALTAGLLLGLAGCAATGSAARPLAADQRVVVEGQVVSVDTSPMAYDGDALVMVTGTAHGAVTVHLPARRHLCKAQGLELLEELKPGERIRVEGVATGPADIRLCQDAADRLQRID